MTKLEKLYDDLDSMGIAVKDFHISEAKKAACVEFDDMQLIALDRAAIDTNAEELDVLGEEYAHYETGTLRTVTGDYNSVQNRINRLADEGRARRHKIQKFIPMDELKIYMKDCVYAEGVDMCELAEQLEVTVEMLKQSLEHYVSHGFRW